MKLSWQRQTVYPRHRFATSRGGLDEVETVVVRFEQDGIVGYGDIVPSALYGQTLEAAESVLQSCRELLDDDPFALESIVARLIARHDDQRATITGVESALYDWCGKKLGVPVWRMLGLDPPQIRTTFTIGVADPDLTRVKIDEALAAGYEALKIKVGVETDEQTLELIRSKFDGPLYLDANEAWTPAEAEERIRFLAQYRPTLIEQPLKRTDWEHLRGLRDLDVAPIFVDEDCERPADVVRLRDHVHGINIKLTKCGGIREALRMITLARGFGLQVMAGCFVSSSLAIAPAMQFASLLDHADLDGYLLLADDPWTGIACEGSVLSLGGQPGLGVVASPAAAIE